MAGTWEITDGQNTRRVTQAEYAALVKDRPAYLPKITVLSKGKMRAAYQNSNGDWVDERVDPEQIEHRAKYGDDISATPETIELARQDGHRRTKEAMASEEKLTTFVNAALPGAQYIQNLAVGVDAATQARQELSRNVISNLTGNIAEFAVGGKALSMGFKGLLGAERAARVGTKLGFGKDASMLGKTGRLLGEDVAISTHLYTQQLLDNNAEFVAEDYAQELAIGLILGGPIIAGGVGRAGGQAALRTLGPGAAGKLSSLGDVLTVGAVLSPPGTMGAAVKARGAAAAHVAGRVMRKLSRRGKGRLTIGDDAVRKQMQHLDDMDDAGRMNAAGMKRMGPAKRAEHLKRYKAMVEGDASWLDGIDWDNLQKDITTMNSQVKGVRKQVLGIHRRFRGEGGKATMSQTTYGKALNEANELLKHTEDVGMSDVKGALRRGILKEGDPAGLQHAMFEARINARFRRGIDGGADIVDDKIRAFTENPEFFNAAQVKRNRAINDALDGVVDVWDELGDAAVGKHIDTIELGDGVKIGNTQRKIQELRGHMDVLADNKILTDDQVRGIETKLVEANDAIQRGTRQYADVIRINRSRVDVSKRLRDGADLQGMDVPTTQEGFAATRDAMVGETAGQMMELGENIGMALAKGINWMSSTKRTVPLIRGVVGLRYLSQEEKTATFETIQKELPTLTGNPHYAMERLSKGLDRGAEYDPVGADLAGMKATNTMYWLASQMPKPDDTIYGRQLPQPTSMQEEYLEKHFAAADPLSVVYAAIQGRVTPAMVAAVRVTSPAMYAQLGSIVAEQLAMADAKTADPQVITGLSLFMGNLDPMYTGKFIMNLQSTYAQTPTQDGVIQGGAANMPRMPHPGSGNSHLTTSQRQQN